MTKSKLKIHPHKTEFILLGLKRQRVRLKACCPIDILGSTFCPAGSVRKLHMWFDPDCSLSKHVQNVCKSCFIQLRDFRQIRQFLAHETSVLLANALGRSRLDYCNLHFRSL